MNAFFWNLNAVEYKDFAAENNNQILIYIVLIRWYNHLYFSLWNEHKMSVINEMSGAGTNLKYQLVENKIKIPWIIKVHLGSKS